MKTPRSSQQLSLIPPGKLPARQNLPVREQISAGGVAYRNSTPNLEIALISVGSPVRWQLPKGRVDSGETPEQAAIREVREEAGIETAIQDHLETIEYWYVGNHRGQRVRFHKFVHFFLLAYLSGDTANHDHEVNEARWATIEEALRILAFKGERSMVERARTILETRQDCR